MGTGENQLARAYVASGCSIDYVVGKFPHRDDAMASVAAKIMSTVSAPYGVLVTAAQLAEKIADTKSADSCDCSVFAFLSEVSRKLQQSFIEEMGVSKDAVAEVARKFSDLAGYKLEVGLRPRQSISGSR